jgi:hypothetical protein
MLLYDISYIILGYFNYFNLYFILLQVIIGYIKILHPKLLYVILFLNILVSLL